MNADNRRLGLEVRQLVPAIQFSLWFFAFMLLESFVNSSFAVLLGAQTVDSAYSSGIFCTATGLLAFGLAHARRMALRKEAVPVAALACSAATLGIALTQRPALLTAFSCASLLTCGFVGGRVHLGVALEFGDEPTCGRILGLAAGSAVCVQFLVQNYTQGPVAVPACILFSLVAIAFLDARDIGSGPAPIADSFAQSRVWPQDPADRRRHGIYLVSAAAILTVIFTLNDAVVVALDASGSLELFSGVRLFYALGLVVAGCLFDLGSRLRFTFFTAVVQMLAVLVPYFLWTPEWYNLNMALFYFYGGFYVIFVTAEFIAFSNQMNSVALWAGLGRTTRSYVTSLCVIPISILYSTFGVLALVALGVVLNMALLAVCVADALLLARYHLPELQEGNTTAREGAAIGFDEQDVEQFAHDMGLTDREREVLVLMVTTEDENQKMANDLNISRRTLQRHIAQVYEKAGVQSRIGLYKSVTAYAADRKA